MTIPTIPYTVQVPLNIFPDYQIVDYISDRLEIEPTEITNLLRNQDILTIVDTWLRDCPNSTESRLTVILGIMRILIAVLSDKNWNNVRVNKDFIGNYKVNLQHAIPNLVKALEDFNSKF